MEFVFVCPVHGKVFRSESFKVVEDRGVVTDESGNRTLDAKVALEDACPFCGERHVYHATELSCPFGS